MLKERVEFVRSILYVFDLLLLSLCFFIAYFIFAHVRTFSFIQPPHPLDLYLRGYWLTLVIWALILRTKEEYHIRAQTYSSLVVRSFMKGLFFIGFFTSAAFIFKYEFISRVWIAFYTLECIGVLLFSRLLIFFIATNVRRRGYNYRNLLLVGSGRRAEDFMRLIARHSEWGYRVISVLDKDPQKIGQMFGDFKIGDLMEMPTLLENHVIDEVVFVVPRNWLKEIEKSILYCEAIGIPATLSTDFFDLEIASGVPKELDGFTYLTFETRQLRDPELLIKRTVDIIFSTAILAVSFPFLFAIAAAVKSTSKGPIFFKQTRCGRNGRQFMLYKFRSMVDNAEQQLENLRMHNQMSGPVFKMADDPRLTKIGRWLRKTSLDEFPQFWNVLKGDMSIVGPRPPISSEVEKYEPWQRRRLSMKPGITCLWQISGRNQIDFDEWMKLDLRYIDRWSLWLDIVIILLTVRAVISGRGAQ